MAVCGIALFWAPRAAAHAFEITEAEVHLFTDGRVEATIAYHLNAYLAGVTYGNPSEADYERLRALPPEELAEDIRKLGVALNTGVRLKFDGEAIDTTISFPDMEASRAAGEAVPLPGHRFTLTGSMPRGAREFVFTASPTFNLVLLSVWREGFDYPRQEFVNPGQFSAPYEILYPQPQSRLSVSLQYLRLGFEHIVPKGLDHILFVLGLFLLGTRPGPLLWQVSAFTVAHTITLALSMYGIVALPKSVVEPLIALSIVYVGIENVATSELKPWRPAVVFVFGLLHGLGFAGVLSELGLPYGRFVTALLSFNVGVELGQLTVILSAFALVGWFLKREWYRARIILPASGAIAAVALYWTVQRIIG